MIFSVKIRELIYTYWKFLLLETCPWLPVHIAYSNFHLDVGERRSTYFHDILIVSQTPEVCVQVHVEVSIQVHVQVRSDTNRVVIYEKLYLPHT